MYKINCIVLGENPKDIFPVNIAHTETVGDLKDLIKDKTNQQFKLVDAKSLKLWQASGLMPAI
ncbi:hypothetical protein BDR07DRAFT_1283563 [Suillus spraguei]|nr:hypothetical protein BDR07DRAFT_1283563 [Suillus spraguei]